MGSWAEGMIVKIVQEESRIKEEEIKLQEEKSQKKKQEASTLAMRLFLSRHIDLEWFWKFIAYTYFVCKTLALFILIDTFIFGKPFLTLFIFIFLCCYYLNLKLYKRNLATQTPAL